MHILTCSEKYLRNGTVTANFLKHFFQYFKELEKTNNAVQVCENVFNEVFFAYSIIFLVDS